LITAEAHGYVFGCRRWRNWPEQLHIISS